jgi:hypothetical protein
LTLREDIKNTHEIHSSRKSAVKLTDDQFAKGNNQKDQERQAKYKLLGFRKEVVRHVPPCKVAAAFTGSASSRGGVRQ